MIGQNDAEFKVGINDTTKKSLQGIKKNFASQFGSMAASARIINGPLDGVAGRLGSVSSALGSMSGAAVAGGLAMGGLTFIMHKAVSEAANVERQLFKTEAILRATGHASGFTGEQLDTMARGLDAATLASTANVRDAQGILLTFRSVAGEAFTRTIELAQDMAVVMGSDIKSATLQLAKALEDPAQGLSALKRSGVSFTNSEKELIKTVYESGDAFAAQSLILDKVAAQVGGAGQGEGAGLAGSTDLLAKNWKELLEAIGDSTPLRVANTWLSQVADTLGIIGNSLAPTLDQQLNNALDDSIKLQNDLTAATEDYNDSWTDYGRAFASQNIGMINTRIDANKRLLVELSQLLGARQREREEAKKAAEENQKLIDSENAQAHALSEANKAAKDNAAAISEWKKEQQEAQRVIAQAATPLQKYESEIERLNQLHTEGAIGFQTYYQAVLQAQQKFVAQSKQDATEWQVAWTSAGDTFASSIADAYYDVVTRERNLAEATRDILENLSRQIITTMVRIAVKKYVLGQGEKASLAEQVAASKVAAAAAAQAWAAAAAETSLASFGANSIPASAAITSVHALSRSLAIAGQAHEGLEYVPRTGTYILQGGEAVIKRGQNKRLSQLMDRLESGGTGRQRGGNQIINNSVTNVSFSVKADDAQSFIRNSSTILGIVQREYTKRGKANMGPKGSQG